MSDTVGRVAWHVHHNVLFEVLTEPIENRIVYIEVHKPKEQRELRLKLLKLIKGPVPKVLDKVCKAYDEACEVHDETSEAFIKAYEAYDKALERSQEAMELLHERECPNCPWDGKTIFAGRIDQ